MLTTVAHYTHSTIADPPIQQGRHTRKKAKEPAAYTLYSHPLHNAWVLANEPAEGDTANCLYQTVDVNIDMTPTALHSQRHPRAAKRREPSKSSRPTTQSPCTLSPPCWSRSHPQDQQANSQCTMGTHMTAALTPPPAYDGRASPCTLATHHYVTQPSPLAWKQEPQSSPRTPGDISASTTSAHGNIKTKQGKLFRPWSVHPCREIGQRLPPRH